MITTGFMGSCHNPHHFEDQITPPECLYHKKVSSVNIIHNIVTRIVVNIYTAHAYTCSYVYAITTTTKLDISVTVTKYYVNLLIGLETVDIFTGLLSRMFI